LAAPCGAFILDRLIGWDELVEVSLRKIAAAIAEIGVKISHVGVKNVITARAA
jgi:hypothetical protein